MDAYPFTFSSIWICVATILAPGLLITMILDIDALLEKIVMVLIQDKE
jgi:hypothetical protein